MLAQFMGAAVNAGTADAIHEGFLIFIAGLMGAVLGANIQARVSSRRLLAVSVGTALMVWLTVVVINIALPVV